MNPNNIRDVFMAVYNNTCNHRNILNGFEGAPNRTICNYEDYFLMLKEVMRMGSESIIELNLESNKSYFET